MSSAFSTLSSITKWEGPKLTGDDSIVEWKQYITAVTVPAGVYRLLEAVEVPHTSAVSTRRSSPDDVPPPPPDLSTETAAQRKIRLETEQTQDQQRKWLWGLLYASLHATVAAQLSFAALNPSTYDAPLLWKELHERYDRTQGIRAGRIQRELVNMKMKGYVDVEHHFNKMRILYNRLLIAGYSFNDQNLAYAMLESLPGNYGTLCGVIYQMKNVTADMVQDRIIAEWERIGMPGLEDKEDESSIDETGLVADFKKTSIKTQRPKRKYYCTEHPSANSHDTKDCKVLHQKARDKKANKSDDDEDIAAIADLDLNDFGEKEYEDIFGMVAVESTALVAQTDDEPIYVVDSAATQHMVASKVGLTNIKACKPHRIIVGGKNVIYAHEQGTLHFRDRQFNNVYYAPELGFNLLSVDRLNTAGYSTLFAAGMCTVQDKTGHEVFTCKGGGLYKVKASTTSNALVAFTPTADSLLYLHCSLGHLNWIDMYRMARSGELGDEWRNVVPPKNMNILCEDCVRGKMHRLSSPPSSVRMVQPNQLVHVDLWGPAKVTSVGGSLYFLTCCDDWSRRIQLSFLKTKEQATSAFKKCLALVNNQCDTQVKRVRSDNGGEFTAKKFIDLLETDGIIPQRIPPAAHAQNGRVERVHLSVMNLVRTMLLDSGLDKQFWSEAASYAAFIRNRIPRQGQSKSPQELWTGQKCSLKQCRPFGSIVYVRDHTEPNKLEARAIKALLMGFQSYSEKTLRYYNPENGKFNYSRDYEFERKTLSSPPTLLSSDIKRAQTPTISPVTVLPGVTPHLEDDKEVTASVLPKIPPLPKTKHKNLSYTLTNEETGKSLFEPKEASYFDQNGKRVLLRNRPTNKVPATLKPSEDFEDSAVIAVLDFDTPCEEDSAFVANADPLAYLCGLSTDGATIIYSLLATDCPTTVTQAWNSPDRPGVAEGHDGRTGENAQVRRV